MELRRRCLAAFERFLLSVGFFFLDSDAEKLVDEEDSTLSKLEEELLEPDEDRAEEPGREASLSEDFMSRCYRRCQT